MAKQPNLFPLKFLVISLGLVLIGGTIFLFASIAHKVGKDSSRCTDLTLSLAKLGARGQVISVTPQGDNVQIALSMPPETHILTLDRCTGTIKQTLTITP
jgi:hypothetical protein